MAVPSSGAGVAVEAAPVHWKQTAAGHRPSRAPQRLGTGAQGRCPARPRCREEPSDHSGGGGQYSHVGLARPPGQLPLGERRPVDSAPQEDRATRPSCQASPGRGAASAHPTQPFDQKQQFRRLYFRGQCPGRRVLEAAGRDVGAGTQEGGQPSSRGAELAVPTPSNTVGHGYKDQSYEMFSEGGAVHNSLTFWSLLPQRS